METRNQVRSDTRRLLIANVNSYKEQDNGCEKMLFADYQLSVPTQHRPSDSHTIQRHLQEELLFKTILSLSSSCPSEPMPLQPEPEQTWSLTRRAFFGRPRCPALPECQALQHDCQAGLPGVLLCQAHQ